MKHQDVAVATLSVFSKTGWVERSLTAKELAVCYDLPVNLHKTWRPCGEVLPFLEATPSKILMAMESSIFETLEPLSSSVKRSVSCLRNENDLPLPLLAAPRTQAGVSVQAAKADDAEAETKLWNDELAELFPLVLKDLSDERLGRVCEMD